MMIASSLVSYGGIEMLRCMGAPELCEVVKSSVRQRKALQDNIMLPSAAASLRELHCLWEQRKEMQKCGGCC